MIGRLLNNEENQHIIWKSTDEKWECSKCGGQFNQGEISRTWDYGENDFHPTYCMDCGALWKKAKNRRKK